MDNSYTSELQFRTYPPKVSKTLHFSKVTQINLTKNICGKLVGRKNNDGKMGSFYVRLYPCAPFYVHIKSNTTVCRPLRGDNPRALARVVERSGKTRQNHEKGNLRQLFSQI